MEKILSRYEKISLLLKCLVNSTESSILCLKEMKSTIINEKTLNPGITSIQ